MTTAPHDISVHGAHSGGLISRFVGVGAVRNKEVVCCAGGGLSLASTAFSRIRHSAPRMHSTIPVARKMDLHMFDSLGAQPPGACHRRPLSLTYRRVDVGSLAASPPIPMPRNAAFVANAYRRDYDMCSVITARGGERSTCERSAGEMDEARKSGKPGYRRRTVDLCRSVGR